MASYRLKFALIAMLLLLGLANASLGQSTSKEAIAASTYEVQINGENFEVQADRIAKLESKEKPGVVYEVAVRVAPTQRVALDTLQFEYDLPARLETTDRGNGRSAQIHHELGYSILLKELQGPLDAKAQSEALQQLTDSVAATLRANDPKSIDISEPHEREFSGSSARGVTIRYRDTKGFEHTCLLYILSGRTFAASCVVDYLSNDADDVLPLIKKTLDSVCVKPQRR